MEPPLSEQVFPGTQSGKIRWRNCQIKTAFLRLASASATSTYRGALEIQGSCQRMREFQHGLYRGHRPSCLRLSCVSRMTRALEAQHQNHGSTIDLVLCGKARHTAMERRAESKRTKPGGRSREVRTSTVHLITTYHLPGGVGWCPHQINVTQQSLACQLSTPLTTIRR